MFPDLVCLLIIETYLHLQGSLIRKISFFAFVDIMLDLIGGKLEVHEFKT